ncbi:hypothetical protein [Alkalibacterium sp. 20]|uniref:hypothetical protein n=1 Tax=Alkalibacterium sp. 20 TaxID=1798803 RepID=UPI00090040A4|nr:hypothetical protein [Alkalibacterium sp. 20]OJF90713.1 hypothetical protein AX762_11590 [Alkalibacterium sp. 20]
MFLSILSFGILFVNSKNSVSAEEFDTSTITTKVTNSDNAVIETTLVPNELTDEWEKLNLPEGITPENEEVFKLQQKVPLESTYSGGFTTFGASAPLFEYWNVSTQGQYNYAGSFSSIAALYTNKAFTGASRYYIKIKNTGSATVIAEARDRVSLHRKLNVPKGYTKYTQVTVGKSFYLKFYGDHSAGSVSGFVRDLDDL